MDNSFTFQDYITARESYEQWERSKAETADEYALRRRQIELYALVNEVISNELNEKDRELVRLHWYDNISATDIAEMLGVEKSTVYRRLDRITDTIYDKLKYAIQYRYGSDYSKNVKPIIKTQGCNLFAARPDNTGERIRNLRMCQCLSIEDVSKMTEIDSHRLSEIEAQMKPATTDELKKLCILFGKSCDYMVFGNESYL